MTIPPHSSDSGYECSYLKLRISTDPTFLNELKEVEIRLDTKEEAIAMKGSSNSIQATNQQPESSDDTEINQNVEERLLTISDLKSGLHYFIQLCAGFDNIDGPPTPTISVLVGKWIIFTHDQYIKYFV